MTAADRDRVFVVETLKKLEIKAFNIMAVAVASPEVFLWVTGRDEWGGTGCVALFDQVHVYYHGQTKMVEFQWRDRYGNPDRPSYQVAGLEDVRVAVRDNTATVKVTIVFKQGKRDQEFSFEDKKNQSRKLTIKERDRFRQTLTKAMDSVLFEMTELWRHKPMMLCNSGYRHYRMPAVKQNVILEKYGVAAFVTEEQIDHFVDDPETQFKLYVITSDEPSPRVVLEDHSYERSEGAKVIAIVELTPDSILVNTDDGNELISISRDKRRKSRVQEG